MAPRKEVGGIAYRTVHASRMTPMGTQRLMGRPRCAKASTTGAGLVNFRSASKSRKRTSRELMTRPVQTLVFETGVSCRVDPIEVDAIELSSLTVVVRIFALS